MFTDKKDEEDVQHPAHLGPLFFFLVIPAVSHTVSSNFPEEYSEASGFIGTLQGTKAARVSGPIPYAAL